MVATTTYKASTPFGGYVHAIDHVAVAAKKLAGFANEMQSVRNTFPDNDDAVFWNKQIRMLGELFQAVVTEMTEDAERHGLETDPCGEWITAVGFEIREMKATAS
ncbi:MAG: hypothetical protein Q7T60_17060 [Sphingopyxis sp.]|nr:hypothetical protein [Sphingopyxis sp.]